jgi:hypothetical protein
MYRNKDGPAHFSEVMASTNKSARQLKPKERHQNGHRRENLDLTEFRAFIASENLVLLKSKPSINDKEFCLFNLKYPSYTLSGISYNTLI